MDKANELLREFIKLVSDSAPLAWVACDEGLKHADLWQSRAIDLLKQAESYLEQNKKLKVNYLANVASDVINISKL